jgi:hypothetical protein
MELGERRWVKLALAGLLVPVLVAFATNVMVDPFDVFDVPVWPRQYQQNQRYLKIEHLERHHDRYTSYMFGSSRIGSTWPAAVEKYLPGERFYNMTVSSGTPLDAYLMLRHLVASGYAVRTAYLQLDSDILMMDHAYPADDLFRRHHPKITGTPAVRFFWDYVTVFPWRNVAGKLQQNFAPGINEYRLDLDGTGRWFWPERDRRIAADWEGYRSGEESFHRPVARGVRGPRLAQNLATLREMKRLCEGHGIRLIVFTNPDHHRMLDMYAIDALLDALRGVASVTGFWDFTGYNAVTLDDRNYYEVAHYRERVGDLIAARIFGDAAAGLPAEFGFFADAGNIEEHLSALRRSLEARHQ